MIDMTRFVSDLVRDINKLKGFLEETMIKNTLNKRFVKINGFKKIIVVGDIHGDFDSLNKIIRLAHREGYPDKALVVFLGDYIDRGPLQLECILAVLLLMNINEQSTIVLRGNHEPPALIIPYPHDFPLVLQRLYGLNGALIYTRFLALFEELPLAAVSEDNYYLFLHGGIPIRNYESENINNIIDYLGGESISWRPEYTEILWNDPVEFIDTYEPSPRGIGYLWGKKITSYIREKFGITKIFRGHEPVTNGYKYNHNESIVTVFSRLGPPYYNERACVVVIDLSLGNTEIRFECWP